MFLPIFVTWKERITPLIFIKGDVICGCKLKTFGTSASEVANWFGNIYDFRYFAKERSKPYGFNDEVVMLLFEILNSFLFARFYLIFFITSVLAILVGLFELNSRFLLFGLFTTIVLYFWPKICFIAYKKYVEEIPQSKGWQLIPIIDNEKYHLVEKLIESEELDKWLKK